MNNVASRKGGLAFRLQDVEDVLLSMRVSGRVQRVIDESLPPEEAAYKIVASHFFRGAGLTPANQNYLTNQIHKSFEQKEPLTFLLGFGAYKTHYSYSYPLPNLAEVFNILYMRVMAGMLQQVYPYGVNVVYLPAVKEITSWATAIPMDQLDKYHRALESIFYKLVSPADGLIYFNNEQLLKRLETSSAHMKKAVEKRMESGGLTLTDEFGAKLLRDMYLAGIPAQSPKGLLEELQKKYLIHEYYVQYANELYVAAFPHAIRITSRKKIPAHFISIKSFYNSVVQFWVGDGVYMLRDGRLYPAIISKNQVRSFEFVDYAALEHGGLADISSYLKYVPVYES